MPSNTQSVLGPVVTPSPRHSWTRRHIGVWDAWCGLRVVGCGLWVPDRVCAVWVDRRAKTALLKTVSCGGLKLAA